MPAEGTVPAAGVYVRVPGTDEVAFSWAAERAVPYVMAAGVAQVITGATWVTTSCTVLVAVVKLAVSVGVKVTERVSVPATGMLPAAGEYTSVPGTEAVAFSCAA